MVKGESQWVKSSATLFEGKKMLQMSTFCILSRILLLTITLDALPVKHLICLKVGGITKKVTLCKLVRGEIFM